MSSHFNSDLNFAVSNDLFLFCFSFLFISIYLRALNRFGLCICKLEERLFINHIKEFLFLRILFFFFSIVQIRNLKTVIKMAVLSQTCGPLWLEVEWFNCVCTYFPQYILPAIYYMGTYEPKGRHLLMALDGFFPLWIYWVEHMYIHYFPSVTCGVMGRKKCLLFSAFRVLSGLPLPAAHFVLCRELQIWEAGTANLHHHQEWVKAQFNTFHSEVLEKWNQ